MGKPANRTRRAAELGWDDGISERPRSNIYKQKPMWRAYEEAYRRGRQLAYQRKITEL